MAFDDLKNAVRAGKFDKRGVEPPTETTPLTFREFAESYKERHVFAKRSSNGCSSTLMVRRSQPTSPVRVLAGGSDVDRKLLMAETLAA